MLKKKYKRFLCAVLSAVLVSGFMPATVNLTYAAAPVQNISDPAEEENSGDNGKVLTSESQPVAEDGIYTLKVKALEEGKETPSMMAAMLDETAKLIVQDGKYTATIKLTEMTMPMGSTSITVTADAITEVWAEPEGEVEQGSGISGIVLEDGAKTFTFPLSTLNKPILAMYVDMSPMNRAVNINLDFDKSTLEKIGDSDTTDITGFESISAIEGGTTDNAIYADADAVKVILPAEVTVAGSAVKVPVSDWVDTDSYNPSKAGSYTFTAVLGELPQGYTNSNQVTATAEIVIKEAEVPQPIVIKDGRYTVSVKALHETKDAPSMMAAMLDQTAQLVVKDGKYTTTIKMTEMTMQMGPAPITVTAGAIREVWAEPQGELESGTGIEGIVVEGDAKTFTFSLSALHKPVLALNVLMGQNAEIQKIRLDFDTENVNSILEKDAADKTFQGIADIVAITKADLAAVKESDVLGLHTADAEVRVPAAVVLKHLKGANAFASLKMEKTEADAGSQASILEAAKQKNDKNSMVNAFDLTLKGISEANEATAITQLGDVIKVSLDLTEAQVSALEDAKSSALYYYDGQVLTDMNASFDLVNKKAAFYTDHLSIYTIISTAKDENTGGGTGGGGTTTPGTTLDPKDLPNGSYTVRATALQETGKKESMCNQMIDGMNIGLSVSKKEIKVTLPMQGTSALPLEQVKELKYQNSDGDYVEADWKVNKNSNSITAKFPLKERDLTKAQYMQVSVTAMGNTKPIFRLVFDTDTLKKGGSATVPSGSGGSVATSEKEYTITATAGTGGTITPSGKVKVEEGKNQIFTIKPAQGYDIKDVKVDKKSVGVVTSYTFKTVKADAEIAVEFKENGQAKISFADIEKHWAKEKIEFVVTKGIFSGTADNTFSPDVAVTRAMFVTVLGRLHQVDVSKYSNAEFTDVKKEDYYASYVAWAVKEGIAKGMGNQQFAPNRQITREEMAVMLNNYVKYASLSNSESKSTADASFADQSAISSWASESVTAMKNIGYLNGKENNRFDPKGNTTRAEAAVILMKIAQQTEK